MNFDPQKFFIGLLDFFSILLPGALITFLLMGDLGPFVLGNAYANLTEGQTWPTFLFASYLVGHLIFLLGSWLDEFYDWARGYTLNTQVFNLAQRGEPLNWFSRLLVWLVFKREQNLAVNRAGEIKKKYLGPLQAKDAINTFQWSKAVLAEESPQSSAAVQRFEADSKFFRCFVVVLVALAAYWLVKCDNRAVLCLVLIPFALWRYMEQRLKATNQAYWSIIALTAKDGKISIDKAVIPKGEPTHAGGVVFQVRGGVAKYLFVEAKDDARQLVLPKGHIEEKESQRNTAVREVHEETGIWAKIRSELEPKSYRVKNEDITVQFFLMESVGCGLQSDTNRRHFWMTFEEAEKRNLHKETKEILASAQAKRGALKP